MNFEIDILSGFVGIGTAIMLFSQIREQSKFSKRIADLEYIKLMEPKLLAVVYDYNNIKTFTNETHANENLNSLPPLDWYKFQFLSRRIRSRANLFNNFENHCKNMTQESKDEYIIIYDEIIKHIKTKDLRKVFENSRWYEFYQFCKKN